MAETHSNSPPRLPPELDYIIALETPYVLPLVMASVSRRPSTSLSPVSSIKRLIRTQSTKNRQGMIRRGCSYIERLPPGIIHLIGRQCDLRDVLHLSLCSHRFSRQLAPILYQTVELRTNKQCKTTLIALSKLPALLHHIRCLIVRPNSLEWTDHGEEVDEELFAGLIASIAGSLTGLERFEWDGLEMPNDGLWLALRASCGNLRRISTTIGDDPLHASSALWDFEDLRQFSLTVKCQTLDWLVDGPRKTEKLPRKFWVMLLEHSPRLEELIIGGSTPSPRMFDIRHVTAGRWPRLRSVTLGDMVLIKSDNEEQTINDLNAFMAFFVAHPGLRHVSLQQSGNNIHFPTEFALPPSALPNLESFGGPLRFVRTLPLTRKLRHLTLTSLHHASSSFPPTIALLRELGWLESLRIWIDLSIKSHGTFPSNRRASGEITREKQDDAYFLRSLILVASGLKHLEVSCFTTPTFSFSDISSILQLGRNLESFVLTKVHKSSDEDLTRMATKIVFENPNLGRFTLRTTHDSWFSPGGGRIRQMGVYEVRSQPVQPLQNNAIDMPDYSFSLPLLSLPLPTSFQALHAREYGLRHFTGKEYCRHFVHVIPPKEVYLRDTNPQLQLHTTTSKSNSISSRRSMPSSCIVASSITAIWETAATAASRGRRSSDSFSARKNSFLSSSSASPPSSSPSSGVGVGVMNNSNSPLGDNRGSFGQGWSKSIIGKPKNSKDTTAIHRVGFVPF